MKGPTTCVTSTTSKTTACYRVAIKILGAVNADLVEPIEDLIEEAFNAGAAGDDVDTADVREASRDVPRYGREEPARDDGRHTNPTVVNGRQYKVGDRVVSTRRKWRSRGALTCQIVAFRPDDRKTMLLRPMQAGRTA